eukprot:366521-Chlamydomonas_euryale.AAC.5
MATAREQVLAAPPPRGGNGAQPLRGGGSASAAAAGLGYNSIEVKLAWGEPNAGALTELYVLTGADELTLFTTAAVPGAPPRLRNVSTWQVFRRDLARVECTRTGHGRVRRSNRRIGSGSQLPDRAARPRPRSDDAGQSWTELDEAGSSEKAGTALWEASPAATAASAMHLQDAEHSLWEREAGGKLPKRVRRRRRAWVQHVKIEEGPASVGRYVWGGPESRCETATLMADCLLQRPTSTAHKTHEGRFQTALGPPSFGRVGVDRQALVGWEWSGKTAARRRCRPLPG